MKRQKPLFRRYWRRVGRKKKEKMTEAISNKQLKHLLDFIGYGTLDADIWFLGMEEAGGGEENIRARLNFKQVEDNAEAHKMLGITKHHWGKRTIQRTWRGMCYIMLCLEDIESTTENIRNYQAEKLGRFDGNTLLYELMPIPKPSIIKWGYEELLPQFTSREDYYAKVKSYRIKLLKDLVAQHQPKAIIAYGKGYWEFYQELFTDIRFEQKGQFLVGKNETTTIVFTDHFTARTMNHKLDQTLHLLKNL